MRGVMVAVEPKCGRKVKICGRIRADNSFAAMFELDLPCNRWNFQKTLRIIGSICGVPIV